jgi:hypothetical protein
MNDIYVYGIGLTAAGMSTWVEGAAILRGDRLYDKAELPAFTPHLLRHNERRRTTALIKLALQVAEQATDNSALSAQNLCSVFACSEGDIDIVDKICEALTMADRPVSPTHFHNSVHNAPAGYWAIATGSHLASISMSAGPGSYAGGLLEAAGLSTGEQCSTLLVSYDFPPPDSLKPLVPVEEAFGSALVVASQPGKNSLAKLQLALNPAEETTLSDSALEALRLSNPAARALPILQAIACKQAQTVVLPYLDGQNLSVTCTPCL